MQLSSGASDGKHLRLGAPDLHQQVHQQRSAALAPAAALKGAVCCDSDELNQQQPGRSQQETARSWMTSEAFEASAQVGQFCNCQPTPMQGPSVAAVCIKLYRLAGQGAVPQHIYGQHWTEQL
jgi:hypothetical protein